MIFNRLINENKDTVYDIWSACKHYFLFLILITQRRLNCVTVAAYNLFKSCCTLMCRVILHRSPGPTLWRLKAVAARLCPCAGPAKTLPLYSPGHRSPKVPQSTPARDPCYQTTWWKPERYSDPVITIAQSLCLHHHILTFPSTVMYCTHTQQDWHKYNL